MGVGVQLYASALYWNQLTDSCTHLPFTALTLLLPVTTPVCICACLLAVEGEVTEALGQFNSKIVITSEQPFFKDVKDLVVQSQQVKHHMWVCWMWRV